MKGRVRELCAGNAEIDLHVRVARYRLDRLHDSPADVRLVQRVALEVPEASPEFRSARPETTGRRPRDSNSTIQTEGTAHTARLCCFCPRQWVLKNSTPPTHRSATNDAPRCDARRNTVRFLMVIGRNATKRNTFSFCTLLTYL